AEEMSQNNSNLPRRAIIQTIMQLTLGGGIPCDARLIELKQALSTESPDRNQGAEEILTFRQIKDLFQSDHLVTSTLTLLGDLMARSRLLHDVSFDYLQRTLLPPNNFEEFAVTK